MSQLSVKSIISGNVMLLFSLYLFRTIILVGTRNPERALISGVDSKLKAPLYYLPRRNSLYIVNRIRLQMVTQKVDLFGTFLILRGKILKISKFQNSRKIALEHRIQRNLRQMKDLGLISRKK